MRREERGERSIFLLLNNRMRSEQLFPIQGIENCREAAVGRFL
jgi:hypothetical protein